MRDCNKDDFILELDPPEPEPISAPFPEIPQNIMNFNFYQPYPMYPNVALMNYPNIALMYPNVFLKFYFSQ
uniref:Uncharacterized protein n=1 Tax=Panagrolaimus davidi TaxID=227884 RepID=A0A914QQN1_9BILA